MYERILVPMDGSGSSMMALEQALAMALAVARLSGAAPALQGAAQQTPQVHVLYVLDDALDQREFVTEGNETLAAAVKRGAEAGVDVRAQMRPANGASLAAAILAQARDLSADLIVLGTHGRRGLRRAIIGSVAEEVIRESPIPVLLPGRPAPGA